MPTSRRVTMMLTDVLDIAVTMKFREALGMEHLRTNSSILEEASSRAHGKILKSLGDSFFVEFESPLDALRCALAVQKMAYDYNLKHREDGDKLWIRMGVHTAELVSDGRHFSGQVIDAASRLLGMSSAGAVCFTLESYAPLRERLPCEARSLGLRRLPWVGEPIEVMTIFPPTSPAAVPGPRSRNLTIMLTDIKDFTSQTAQRSRAEISLMLDRHKEILLPVFESKGGRLVKELGDSFLVTFESPTDAVIAGVDAQDAIRRYNEGTAAEHRFKIRVALNQGEVVLGDNDVYGDPVNIASRIEDLAEPGEVYLTDAVYLSMNKKEVQCSEMGLFSLKGVAEKVRVFKVGSGRPQEAPGPSPAPAPAAPPPAFVAATPEPGTSSHWESGPASLGEPDELIGKEVGPCRIESIIGRGGMGVVFKARHTRLDRPVAVKVIIPSIHRAVGAALLLLNEARLVARLEDPRIAQVYDVGTQGSLSFVVMQFVDGETLENLVLRKGRLTAVEALAVMKEVLLGLAAAHAKGIVHRDLKPTNILIDRSGAVKLLDFGIAKVSGDEDFAPDATFSGTLDFMAPEQAFGTKPDPRMDLYSFGATWFFVLTGTPPFSGATAVDVLMKHREAPVPDVRERNPEVTPAVAALISRLMQKSPEARPASAAEVLQELAKPGMTMAVDQSGSPFKILPPPVELAVGLAAEMKAMGRPMEEVAAAASAPDGARGAAAGLPPPPPAVDYAPGDIPLVTRAVFGALFFVFFGTPWRVLTQGDWLAAGAALTVAAAVMSRLGVSGVLQRAVGPLLLVFACFCFFRFGAAPGEGFPRSLPGFEVLVVACLGLFLAGAGVYLGFLETPPEKDLAAALLCAGGVVLALAGIARALPESAGLVDGISSRGAEVVGGLARSGGIARWAGPAVLFGAYRFSKHFTYDPATWCRRKTSDGRIINWNK